MAKILLVDDECNFAMVMRDYLRMHGYEVTLCADGKEGLEAFGENRFDVCILDIMMPRMDGFSLASQIRSKDARVPFIFLTARGQRDDMLKGYALGCDDYVVKPFDSEILLMKVRAIINRSRVLKLPAYSIGSLSFDVGKRMLVNASGSQQRLSPKEAALLEMLCQNRNQVVSRPDALKQIWKEDNYFTGRSMDVYITKLRKHLEEAPEVRIENLHGSGYVLRDSD